MSERTQCIDINPDGMFDIRLRRWICASHAICPAGREGIDIISHLPLGKYIAFPQGKNIELRSNISTKILPEKEL